LEDLGIDDKIILRRIIRKWDAGAWTALSWLRIRTVGGRALLNAVIKLRGSIKCGEIPE
jgi:hypothetical protein